MNTTQYIWEYLRNKGFSAYGVAGIMGNMQAESCVTPNNLQSEYNVKLNMTDAQYTAAVDNGSYTNFVHDSAGYGLVQWTYYTLKQDLYNLCKQRGKSIADVDCQLDCLCQELTSMKLIDTLKNAKSTKEASDYFLTQFERPKNQTDYIKNLRAGYGQEFYNQFSSISVKGGNKMKYNSTNKPLVCMMTNSTNYKGTGQMDIKGVLWHSTGANNPTLKRYVQPSDNDPNRAELMAKLGKNLYGNDWNHTTVQAGLNAWVGKLEDGTVTSVQTMPWNYRPWGCGAGSRGSCNNGWIQFEICEDNLTDKPYFEKAYKEACELTAYLCKMYNLNPQGSVNFNGVSVPVILCHQDSYQLGLGSDHSDVYHWFTRYGKTMTNVRADVAALVNGSSGSITPSDGGSSDSGNGSGGSSSNKPMIGKGDTGTYVKELQEALLKLGYSLPQWGADGDFGNETYAAVIKFQQDKGLEVDGVVGPMTWAAIEKALGNNTQPSNGGSNTPSTNPTPSTDPNEIYRIRKDWSDVKSQIGAYRVLDNAKAACDKAGSAYKVFNSKGQVIYPTGNSTSNTTTKPAETSTVIVVPATKYNDVMLGSASKDERGQYHAGSAGDQTGVEVHIQNWYNGGWNYVIRPNSAALAEKIAAACEKACNNNNIGYDQDQRNTLLAQVKKVGYDMSKVSTPCECDCSSLVSTCCVCAGLDESIFFPGGNGCTTYNLLQQCNKTGQFTALSSTSYTRSKEYLKRGDILLAGGHTVIVLQNGNKVNQVTVTTVTVNPHLVRITADKLNVRSQPSNDSAVTTQVKKGGVFTIIEEKEGWGRLKSGAGWINLSYTEKV